MKNKVSKKEWKAPQITTLGGNETNSGSKMGGTEGLLTGGGAFVYSGS